MFEGFKALKTLHYTRTHNISAGLRFPVDLTSIAGSLLEDDHLHFTHSELHVLHRPKWCLVWPAHGRNKSFWVVCVACCWFCCMHSYTWHLKEECRSTSFSVPWEFAFDVRHKLGCIESGSKPSALFVAWGLLLTLVHTHLACKTIMLIKCKWVRR